MSAKRLRDDDMTPYKQADDCQQRHKKHRQCMAAAEEPSLESADLLHLLDLTDLTSESDISTRFTSIASQLIHKHRICLTYGDLSTKFNILELEFYLYKPHCHEDPFTHGAEEQRRSGNWYFHKVPRRSTTTPLKPSASITAAGGYRGGTRKGLDLTFGMPSGLRSPYFSSESPREPPPDGDIIGGILLRTIQRVSDSQVISGPSLLVDEILRLNQASSISSLVKDKWNDDIFAFHTPSSSSKSRTAHLYLQRLASSARDSLPQIHTSPRIGLDLSNFETTESLQHPRVMYMSRPYRYFVNPHLLISNGRSQTLYGLYRELSLDADYTDEYQISQELAKLSGLKLQSVLRYLSDYHQGYESGKLKSFIGVAGKGASASPATYLRLMGTLQRAFDDTS